MIGLLRFLPIVVAALLAAGTWWLADVQRRHFGEPKTTSPTNPDFIVDQARMSRLGTDGRAQTLVNADRVVHYLSDDRSVLEHPRVLQTQIDRPPVTITADAGESRNRLGEVVLTRNVHVTRAATPSSSALELRTERLVILPDEDRVTSDTEVNVKQAGSTVTGIGMSFNNSYRTLDVEHRVRATFAARKKAAS